MFDRLEEVARRFDELSALVIGNRAIEIAIYI
jgi:hypothetical protein